MDVHLDLVMAMCGDGSDSSSADGILGRGAWGAWRAWRTWEWFLVVRAFDCLACVFSLNFIVIGFDSGDAL
jgi:hypothetical protein